MRRVCNIAAEMLPVRLMVSIAMIAAIIVLLLSASSTLRTFLAEQEVEEQCRALQASLSTMVGSGALRDVDDLYATEGTKRMHTFSLPDSLIYLCFGGDPDSSNTGNLTPMLVEDGAVICYKVQGGSKKVIWLPKETYKFREGRYIQDRWVINGDGESFIIRRGGTLTLVFENVQRNHKAYILIHQNDGIRR